MSKLVMPEGSLIEVRMTLRLPHAATPEQIDEWLSMEIGKFGSMSVENPLSRDEPESWGFRIPKWRDTDRIGRVVDSPHVQREDGHTYWTTRYVEDRQP